MKRKIILLTFLISLTFALNACPNHAYAADSESLTVNAAWTDGDLLKINVTDKNGANSTLALRLEDYIEDVTANEYISIQATDLNGNKSGVIQVKNPYYAPSETGGKIPEKPDTPDITVEITTIETMQTTQNGSVKPLTPDGSGTVMDNVFDGDGKEFFTVKTEEGNVFYLIVDRQRNSANVYLLNAVTEDDLYALAQKSKGNSGAIPVISAPETTAAVQTTQTTVTTEAEIHGKTGGLNGGAVAFIILAALGAGGAGYYFKIYKNKNKSPDSDSDNDDYGDETDDYEDEADELEEQEESEEVEETEETEETDESEYDFKDGDSDDE